MSQQINTGGNVIGNAGEMDDEMSMPGMDNLSLHNKSGQRTRSA